MPYSDLRAERVLELERELAEVRSTLAQISHDREAIRRASQSFSAEARRLRFENEQLTSRLNQARLRILALEGELEWRPEHGHEPSIAVSVDFAAAHGRSGGGFSPGMGHLDIRWEYTANDRRVRWYHGTNEMVLPESLAAADPGIVARFLAAHESQLPQYYLQHRYYNDPEPARSVADYPHEFRSTVVNQVERIFDERERQERAPDQSDGDAPAPPEGR